MGNPVLYVPVLVLTLLTAQCLHGAEDNSETGLDKKNDFNNSTSLISRANEKKENITQNGASKMSKLQ